MRLLKCYISSFGKLKDFTYDFTDTKNTFMYENGWGKTTFAYFIKSMFYGLNGERKHSVSENERVKFKPWGTTQKFGGYIEFVWGEKEYRIQRLFGNKEGDDEVVFTDISTGKQYSTKEEWGERIFQIDQDGFLSTILYSQSDVQVKSNSSLTSKFNAQDTLDATAYDKAIEKLTASAKNYSYSGERGLIPETKRNIASTKDKIEQISGANDIIVELKNKYSEAENQLQNIKKDIDNLNEKFLVASKNDTARYKQNELAKKKNEKSLLETEKNNLVSRLKYIPSDDELKTYFDSVKELNDTKNKVDILTNDLSKLNVNNEIKVKKHINPFVFLAISVVLIGLSVGMFFVNTYVGIAVCVLAVASAFLTVYKFVVNEKPQKNEEVASFIDGKKQELINYREIYAKYLQVINVFIDKFGIAFNGDYYSFGESLRSVVQKVSELDNRIALLNADIENFEKDTDINISIQSCESVEEIKKLLDVKTLEQTEKINQIAKLQREIDNYEESIGELSALQDNLITLTENLANYTDDFDILKTTATFLKQADINLKTKYRKPLEDSLNEYLSLISEKSFNAKIDIDLNVTIEENGLLRESDFYSTGYKNIFNLCKRFALIKVLFTKEKPFIILDDPFSNLDNENLSLALKLVDKLSKEYQILYLVCHQSRIV